MTEIVTTFSCEHHFQYVERRYSGFVALSFVVTVDTRLSDVRNQRVKTPKNLIGDAAASLTKNASDRANPAD
jgi:hypothetical protein